MQIYFLGCIPASTRLLSQYLKIIDTLEAAGHTVLYSHIINNRKPVRSDYPASKDKGYFEASMSYLRYSDAVFAEVSECDANMSYEIAYALENNLPVACFYNVNAKLPAMIESNSSRNFTSNPYSNEQILEEAVKKIQDTLTSEMRKIVSIPLTIQVGLYLDWISKAKRCSRSTFVRGLIEAKMKKDSEYKKLFHNLY